MSRTDPSDPLVPDPLEMDQDELDRLEQISDLNLLSPDIDQKLVDASAAAATMLNLPIGLVSIVLDSAQFFAASHGIEGWISDANGTPSEWSFCQHAVRTKKPYVVQDAALDPLVSESPLVTRDGIRCYLGIPLVTSSGHALGTLCVIGSEPRDFSQNDIDALSVLARDTTAYIEARGSEW